MAHRKKIIWRMVFMPFAKFFMRRLVKKIYKDGYYDGVAFAKARNQIIRGLGDIRMTPSQWMTALRLTEKTDKEGRKILFVDGVEIK